MKNNNTKWYLGYGISAAIILLIAFTDLSREMDLALSILFAVVFSVSHTQILHSKMLRTDDDYRINVMDERNIMIKEKAGNITNMVTLVLLGLATVLFIALDYIIPAVVTGIIVAVQPLVLIIISSAIEKKV